MGGVRTLYASGGGGVKSLKMRDLLRKKKERRKITVITAYDFIGAQVANSAMLDCILVGDSLANVVLGHARTNQIGMDEMLYHCKSVTRGNSRCFVIGDMPFGSYSTVDRAVQNAIRFVNEGGVAAVKIEGPMYEQIKAVSQLTPVVGHTGVLPQTAENFLARGKTAKDAQYLVEEAQALEAAGCCMIVLEKVCSEVAEEISRRLTIPTIGIGAGPHCDGQVLVWHDVLGLQSPGSLSLKFVRRFGDGWRQTAKAVEEYATAVERETFPHPQHNSFLMDPGERDAFIRWTEGEPLSPADVVVDQGGEPALSASGVGGMVAGGLKRVLVIGSGGMASLVAYMLATKGDVAVTVATRWQQQASAISSGGGLSCVDPLGNPHGPPVTLDVVTDDTTLPQGAFDLAIILIKSADTERAAKLARRAVRPDGCVLSLQNGLDAPLELKKAFKGRDGPKLLLGTTTNGALVRAGDEGRVWRMGEGETVIGAAERKDEACVERVRDLLNAAALTTRTVRSQDVLETIWHKLAINAVVNPLTALYGVNNGALTRPHFEPLISQIAQEVSEVGRARGIRLPEGSNLVKVVQRAAETTAANTSSMRTDVENRLPTEISAICGAIASEARKVGLSAPVNEMLVHLIKALEEQRQTTPPAPASPPLPPQPTAAKETHAALAPTAAATSPPMATRVCKTPSELMGVRSTLPASARVAFVPFLGGLHDGHMALLDEASRRGDRVWTSLFLNQLQFQSAKDFETYPMRLDEDIAKLRDRNVEVIFTPNVQDIYPTAEDSFPARVDFAGIEAVDGEGKERPGFFRGIGTVLTKFFAWTRPSVVVFGQKDFLQTVIVRKLCAEFFPDVEVAVVPTVREKDGLAFASRNARLTPEERKRAPLIYQTLQAVEAQHRRGERDAGVLTEAGRVFAASHGLSVDYITVCDLYTGKAADVLQPTKSYCVAIGASVGPSCRLVDNIVLEAPKGDSAQQRQQQSGWMASWLGAGK
ncbi:unnamed protein product [Vitrella brassicaformis CCMP3155]|uniref:Pantoate--beta-alanine ligase n=2 Tax=Vitrella brassicaformis TaxID=1169539 RepID=A0A0G4FZ92_VITBC|nr:unnamed protein product [Vitrella brassicaformis CCMP3155]|eukprot:CEM20945.1 unnamed protein product [Vitrella brassicaformis CCMP3155]